MTYADVQALVESTGSALEAFERNRGRLPNSGWPAQRDMLTAMIDRMGAALAEVGLSEEHFGWTVTRTGRWQRLGSGQGLLVGMGDAGELQRTG